jgi:hypothetical protein
MQLANAVPLLRARLDRLPSIGSIARAVNPFWVKPKFGLSESLGGLTPGGRFLKSIFTEEYESFLQRLISARKAAGITQQDLALDLRKPQSFVSKYERRERRIDVVEFVTICRSIHVDPCRIIREIERRLDSRAKRGSGN